MPSPGTVKVRDDSLAALVNIFSSNTKAKASRPQQVVVDNDWFRGRGQPRLQQIPDGGFVEEDEVGVCEEAVVEAPAQLRHLRLDVLCPETRVLEMNKILQATLQHRHWFTTVEKIINMRHHCMQNTILLPFIISLTVPAYKVSPAESS